jgi:hypothetical protein
LKHQVFFAASFYAGRRADMLGFRLSPGAAGKKQTQGIAWQVILVTGIIAGGLFVGWIAGHGRFGGETGPSARDLEIDPRPVITSLQKLGELHTVKVSMKDVLRQSSEKQAEGWMQGIPGGNALTQWATHNEALVVAQGYVEAGVDLSSLSEKDVTHVRLPDGTQGLRVHLPPVQLYPPQITLRVENTQSGLLWSDVNLIPKAEEKAAKRFQEAAEKDNIRVHAQENAIQTLQQLEQTLGNKNIQFSF